MMNKFCSFRFFAISALFVFSFNIFSCKEDKANAQPEDTQQGATLNLATRTVSVGDTLHLIPEFTSSVTNPDDYTWGVDDENILTLAAKSDYSVTVTAKSEGSAKVYIFSPGGKALDSCVIQVIAISGDGVIKVLAIGNSFSDDAVEHYLYGLADAAGEKIIIGNMYIGGAKLGLHWENAEHNKAAYSYRKIGENGTKTTTANTSIATALADEDWDYISFQQASIYSGRYSTFVTPLSNLYAYVKERAKNPNVKYVLHQTWAYAEYSDHAGYDTYYNSDQLTMYHAIVDAYQQAKKLINADLIIPDGTAIQNGRTSVAGDNFNRDGHHLNVLGRYTASCTWFEKLFGKSVIGNIYKPDELTDYEAEIAQHAAHLAVAYPDKVTQMTDYQNNNTTWTAPVLINFGKNEVASAVWNSLSSYSVNSYIMNLKDEMGAYTGLSVAVREKFSSINTNGPTATSTDFNMPASVSGDNFYGHLTDWNGRPPVPQGVLEFEGLDKNRKYDFCFFAGRANVKDNRETKYIVSGETKDSVLLNASNNTSHTVCIDGIKPKNDGSVIITVTAGKNNTEPHKFYYLTAMKVSPVEE